MRQQVVWMLWGLASIYGLWRGVRLAFFPIAMQATEQAARPGDPLAPEVMSPDFFAAGLPLLVMLLVMYLVLGYTLYSRQYTIFQFVAGVHIVLSLLGGSIAWLFLPSSALLLLAILLLVALPRTSNRQQGIK
jgi:hypothetical protein